MSKFEVVCPHCRKPNAVEKTSFGALGTDHGQQDIQCSHCLKRWKEDLGETGSLTKSAPSQATGMAELRQRLIELGKVVDAYVARRAAAQPARFNTNGREVEKSDEINREFLNKALANGTRIDVAQPEGSTSPRFQTVESVGSGQRVRSGAPFDTNGVEKSDIADAELQRALANGKPVGFVPRGN
jgi:hypothetical protein